jgi:serine/threonine protein kinase
MVRYRNREVGHGAAGQRPAEFYDRMGRALLTGLPELLGRLDVLVGRRLIYFADVRRQASGTWLIERYELIGETARRIESMESVESETTGPILPERVYLESTSIEAGAANGPGQISAAGASCGRTQEPVRPKSLHPLVVYDPGSAEALYLTARRGKDRAEYLCYSSGRVLERQELFNEHRELLARVLRISVGNDQAEMWATRSRAEEEASYAAGLHDVEVPVSRRVGEFELLSKLGSGGMGVVYRAWQPSLSRQVALKCLLRTGDPKAEGRFAREIRALGRVDHPHVVKIFTSGSEADQWFFAMELVEGATLAAVCDKLQKSQASAAQLDLNTWRQTVSTVCEETHQAETPLSSIDAKMFHPRRGHVESIVEPPLPARGDYVRHVVALMRQVAEGAHALHEAGVVHRDIKPGNILVTPDGVQAVLMDLGLAQLADDVEGRLTRTRQFVGTLRYASPEQILSVGRLDRRSDVYSIGATLWELLALRPIYAATEETPTPELMQRIQFSFPERLGKYRHGISRDLEAIVFNCLEKNPDGRYATAHGLASDLSCYLSGEPVQARPVGEMVRFWRWCRRKPALAGMFAAIVLLAIGSLIGLSFLYANAARQRQIAEHNEAGAKAITRFYEDYVLSAARPKGWEGGIGKDVSLKQALDQAGSRIEEAFVGQPELEAAVRNTVGMTYYYLGQFDAAGPHLERAYQIRVDRHGLDHADTLASLDGLAMVRWKQDRIGDAVALARQAFDGRRLVLGAEHEDTLHTQLNLGLFLSEEKQLDEAEAMLRDAIATCKRVLGPDHRHTLYGQNDLAIILNSRGKYSDALKLDLETLEGRKRTLGPEHPDTLRSLANTACDYSNLDNLEEAETKCREALEGRRRVLGEEHTETFWSVNNLAGILEDRGKLVEAEKVRRDACDTARRLLGQDDPVTLAALTRLGNFLRGLEKYKDAKVFLREAVEGSERKLGKENASTLQRRFALARLFADEGSVVEAEKLYREVLAAQVRVSGPDHSDTLYTKNNLAFLLSDQGDNTGAEKLYREIFKTRCRVQGQDHPDTLFAQNNLAAVLQSQERWAEAEEHYRAVLKTRERLNGPDHWSTLSSKDNLAQLFVVQGKPAEGGQVYRHLFEINQRVLGKDNPRTLLAQKNLAWALECEGRWNDAEKLYRQTLETERRVNGPDHPDTLVTQQYLARVLGEMDKADEAEKLYRSSLETQRRTPGPDHASTLATQYSLATFLEDYSQQEQAEKLYRQTLLTERRVRGPEHPSTLVTQGQLAKLLAVREKFKEAEDLFVGVLARQRETLPPDHLDLTGTEAEYGNVLTNNGRATEGEPLLRRALATREKKLPPEDWRTANVRTMLGACLAHQGRFADADALLVSGATGMLNAKPAPPKRVAEAIGRIVTFYEKKGRPGPAKEWRKKLEDYNTSIAASH